MPTSDDNPSFNYKPGEYVPSAGNLETQKGGNTAAAVLGYHNEDKLRSLLAQIIKAADAIITSSENDLTNYSLKIDSGSKLHQAQLQEWPSNMGDPKMYISFEEYKALERTVSRGSEYIRSTYEDYVRGPFGTNAIDTLKLANALKAEASNITKFLDNYLGDVDDSSEYRTLELLQDWAESGLQHAANIATVFSQRVKNEVQIPASELDQIGEADARSYQALFQTKVNAVNKELGQLTEDLDKEHHVMSEIFYDKFLGPALKFRLNAGRTLESNISQGTFLANQAGAADQSLGAHYISLLADQMKRNENFDIRMSNAVTRIRVRDNYSGYTRQLNTKLERETPTPFVKTTITDEEVEGFKSYVAEVTSKIVDTNTFTSAHELLDGKDADDAHPQYLLRAGDTITGDIAMDDGTHIGGMEPKVHRHRGLDVDGTEKIHGEDIVDLPTSVIDRSEPICRPANLRHVNSTPHTGSNNITLINSQIAWDCDPDMSFEVQTVPVGARVASTPALEWIVTTLGDVPGDFEVMTGLGSDYDFITYASQNALYNFNYLTAITTLIAGSPTVFGDAVGDSLAVARFYDIHDLTQDFKDGRVYIADGNKIKMTGPGTATGHTLPMDVKKIYQSPYPIKRLDAQPQNFLNTLYSVEGPTGTGKDRVMKLSDTDNNTSAAGTAVTGNPISQLSEKWTINDIAVSPNGFVYLLTSDNLLKSYDPNNSTVSSYDVSDEAGTPTSITADFSGNVYITYSNN